MLKVAHICALTPIAVNLNANLVTTEPNLATVELIEEMVDGSLVLVYLIVDARATVSQDQGLAI